MKKKLQLMQNMFDWIPNWFYLSIALIALFFATEFIGRIAHIYGGWSGPYTAPFQEKKRPKYKLYFGMSALLSIVYLSVYLHFQWPEHVSNRVSVVASFVVLSLVYFGTYKRSLPETREPPKEIPKRKK